jgi:hypothetical protein
MGVRLGDECVTKEPDRATFAEWNRKRGIGTEPARVPVEKHLGFCERASRWTARCRMRCRAGDGRQRYKDQREPGGHPTLIAYDLQLHPRALISQAAKTYYTVNLLEQIRRLWLPIALSCLSKEGINVLNINGFSLIIIISQQVF